MRIKIVKQFFIDIKLIEVWIRKEKASYLQDELIEYYHVWKNQYKYLPFSKQSQILIKHTIKE